jgi:hypothetical protein
MIEESCRGADRSPVTRARNGEVHGFAHLRDARLTGFLKLPPGAFASHFGLDGEAHLQRRFRARRLCASDARGNGQCDGVRS